MYLFQSWKLMMYESDKGIKRYKKCHLPLAYKILRGSSWLYDGLSLEVNP